MRTVLIIMILGTLTAQAFGAELEGYECKYKVDSKRFSQSYETQGHIITSIETKNVYQSNVLGLPFIAVSGTYPEANVYTYDLRNGHRRLLLQLVGGIGSNGDAVKIVDVGVGTVVVESDVEGEFPAHLKLSCTRI